MPRLFGIFGFGSDLLLTRLGVPGLDPGLSAALAEFGFGVLVEAVPNELEPLSPVAQPPGSGVGGGGGGLSTGSGTGGGSGVGGGVATGGCWVEGVTGS